MAKLKSLKIYIDDMTMNRPTNYENAEAIITKYEYYLKISKSQKKHEKTTSVPDTRLRWQHVEFVCEQKLVGMFVCVLILVLLTFAAFFRL